MKICISFREILHQSFMDWALFGQFLLWVWGFYFAIYFVSWFMPNILYLVCLCMCVCGVCACMFECMCVTVSARGQMQMQASGWTASLPQSLSTYSLRCGFTFEPKAHWHSWSIRPAHSCRHGGWVLVCCLPNSRVTDRFPCPSDTYMGAKDLLSGPSPVLVLGLTGVFTMSLFPSTNWFGLVFWNMFLLCSLYWVPWDSLCSLAGFGLGLILLPLPCKFWDGIWEPPHPG